MQLEDLVIRYERIEKRVADIKVEEVFGAGFIEGVCGVKGLRSLFRGVNISSQVINGVIYQIH